MKNLLKTLTSQPRMRFALLLIFSIPLIFLLGGCDLSDYWLSVDTFGEGEVVVEPDRRRFSPERQEKVELRAVPATRNGYQFSHWEGDVPDHIRSQKNIELFMDRHRDIEAVFINPHIEEEGFDEYSFYIDNPGTTHKTIGERHEGREIYEIEGSTDLPGLGSVQIYIWLPAEKAANPQQANSPYIWRGFADAEDTSGDGIDLKYEFHDGTERYLARKDSGEITIKRFYHNKTEDILAVVGEFQGGVHLYNEDKKTFPDDEETLNINGSFSAMKK